MKNVERYEDRDFSLVMQAFLSMWGVQQFAPDEILHNKSLPTHTPDRMDIPFVQSANVQKVVQKPGIAHINPLRLGQSFSSVSKNWLKVAGSTPGTGVACRLKRP